MHRNMITARITSKQFCTRSMSPTNRRRVVVAFAQTLQHEWDDLGRSLGFF
jgi:hypothetical protein